jgi:hypothetical protein
MLGGRLMGSTLGYFGTCLSRDFGVPVAFGLGVTDANGSSTLHLDRQGLEQ